MNDERLQLPLTIPSVLGTPSLERGCCPLTSGLQFLTLTSNHVKQFAVFIEILQNIFSSECTLQVASTIF